MVKDVALNPVGSGPYRFVGWEPGGGVVLEANADYWQGVPDVDNLIFRAEPDADKRLGRLVAGEASLITDLSPDQAEAVNTEHTRMMAVESTRRLFVGLRSQEGTPLADKRVRQALNYAVDVEALV